MLKSFAPAVRRQLMEAVERKLDYVLAADSPELRAAVAQVKSLRQQAERDRAGLVERVAYTWFNRLAALRFLDALGWHPFKARVLTPANAEETQPEILKLLRTGSLPAELQPHTDTARLNDLLDGRLPTAIAGADPQGEAYRGLILAVCRFYHTLLPDIFDKLNDASEFLLPDDLLTPTSVAEGFRTEISDAACLETDASGKSRANVEILGWLYQFYISEKKDAVMARKKAVPTEDIPAVTQLFTPHWIVRYLVENSLGRLWLNSRPNSRLREHMPYYIGEADGKKEEGRMEKEEGATDSSFIIPNSSFELRVQKPEDIRLLDPAVGSGHMLTYAFDLLYLIYEEEGYAPSEIPGLILRHNLYGLEICTRAAQLATLALVFKAREKSRRFFQPGHLVRPHIIELQDIRFEEGELQAYFNSLGHRPSTLHPQLAKLLHQFEESKNFGSLIQPSLTEAEIQDVQSQLSNLHFRIDEVDLMIGAIRRKVLRVLEQAEALSRRHHLVVANPPYMGLQGMNSTLATFVTEQFPDSKADLMTCIVERAHSMCTELGYIAAINLPSWMFLKSFESFRAWLLNKNGIVSLLHNGRGVFGADFGTVAFVLVKSSRFGPGVYGRLFEKESSVDSQETKLKRFFDRSKGWSQVNQKVFAAIPGSPIAYWISPQVAESFPKHAPLSSAAFARKGLVRACPKNLILGRG